MCAYSRGSGLGCIMSSAVSFLYLCYLIIIQWLREWTHNSVREILFKFIKMQFSLQSANIYGYRAYSIRDRRRCCRALLTNQPQGIESVPTVTVNGSNLFANDPNVAAAFQNIAPVPCRCNNPVFKYLDSIDHVPGKGRVDKSVSVEFVERQNGQNIYHFVLMSSLGTNNLGDRSSVWNIVAHTFVAVFKFLHWNQSISKGIIIKPQQRKFLLRGWKMQMQMRPLFHSIRLHWFTFVLILDGT